MRDRPPWARGAHRALIVGVNVAVVPGRAALPVVALGVALALLGYAAVLLRVAPTPAGLRRALAV